MEAHLQTRPQKTPLAQAEQERLRALAIDKIRTSFLPDKKMIKIVLIGSSVKGSFGTYASPGFRGSLFSDFDFIVFVKDDYTIPDWLEREPNGKPFGKEELDLAYRQKKFIENKYDAEIFFIRESSLTDQNIRSSAEDAGIPLDTQSVNPFLIIWETQS